MFRQAGSAVSLFSLLAACPVVAAEDSPSGQEVNLGSAVRELFDFSSGSAASQWQIVNDGVMGGRSSSRVERTGEGIRFSGNLSLANNGGFASMRSRPKELSLKSSDTIVLRVRGDGRTYTFNLYVPQRQMAFSYRMEFRTVAGQWAVVRLPLKNFVATSFGRVVQGMSLSTSQINSVGILLGDKRPGSFAIEVDSIGVVSD
jgi:monofunctional biosynthetic peptidoglycan transglycosylase